MKALKILLLTSGLLVYYDASGQVSIDRSVIGATGTNEVSSGNTSASWTVGETAVNTETNGTITLSEGFHQGIEDNLSVEVNTPSVDLKVYPNPTQDKVFISVDATSKQSIHFVLYTALGQEVLLPENSMNVSGHTEKSLDFSHLTKGTYLLHVTSENGVHLSTIRIIKN